MAEIDLLFMKQNKIPQGMEIKDKKKSSKTTKVVVSKKKSPKKK